GNGDVLTLQYGMSPFPPGSVWDSNYGKSVGMNPLLDFKYSLPFTARDTTVSFEYRKIDEKVIEKPFDQLDIESKSEIFSLGLRQPIYRKPGFEFALGILAEYLQERTFLLGEQFSLSPGAKRGVSTVNAIRPYQEFTYRTQNQVIAGRSRFSVGVDLLDATKNDEKDVPDSRFFAWLGQFQWVRRVPEPLDRSVIFPTPAPLAPD